MSSVSALIFDVLCEAGNAIAAQRERFDPASDGWLQLTQMLDAIDTLVDQIVLSPAIEAPEDGCV